jgi:hypothetical protein
LLLRLKNNNKPNKIIIEHPNNHYTRITLLTVN